MTISKTTSRWDYTGDGVSTAFAFDNVIFGASDMTVYVDGVRLSTGFSVSGVGGESGTVTFSAPPAAGAAVSLVRDVPPTQETAYPRNDPFPAEKHERGLDKLTILVQQILTRVRRTLSLPESEAGSDLTLPGRDARAGRYLAFDPAGAPIAVEGSEGPVDVSGRTVTAEGAAAAHSLAHHLARLPDAAVLAQGATVALPLTWLFGRTLTPEMFGAVGDGATDDTAALQAWLDAIGGGAGIGFMSPGVTYIHTAALYVRGGSRIRAYGAVLKAASTAAATVSGLHFTNEAWTDGVDFVTVEGLYYDGNRAARPAGEGQAAAFYMVSCNFITLRDCQAVNCKSDGFYVGGDSGVNGNSVEIRLDNCRASTCLRNGLSVVGVQNLYVSGGSYNDTSGAALGPNSGIDLEPDGASTANTGVWITNVEVAGNAGDGIVEQTVYNSRVVIDSVNARSNGGWGVSIGSARNKVVAANIFGAGNGSGLIGGAYGVDAERPANFGAYLGQRYAAPAVSWSTTTTGTWQAVTGGVFAVPAHYASALVVGFLACSLSHSTNAQTYLRLTSDGTVLNGSPANVWKEFNAGEQMVIPFRASLSGASTVVQLEAQLANAATLTVTDVYVQYQVMEAE